MQECKLHSQLEQMNILFSRYIFVDSCFIFFAAISCFLIYLFKEKKRMQFQSGLYLFTSFCHLSNRLYLNLFKIDSCIHRKDKILFKSDYFLNLQ